MFHFFSIAVCLKMGFAENCHFHGTANLVGPKKYQTRQNGLQNNWLLRAYLANIQEIEQHFQVFKAFPTQKTTNKMCDHPKKILRKCYQNLSKVFKALIPKQKTARKCVAIQKKVSELAFIKLPSTRGVISLTKDRHKMCGHPKLF